MGRQQYLERLALGRSAFEDSDAVVEGIDIQGPSQTATNPRDNNGEQHAQQYDNKGRPTNPLTDERNAALRNAQNAVLSLVGVVESKDESDRLEKANSRPLRETRQRMLEDEDQRGEDLSVPTPFVQRVLTWWPETILARVQAGLYAPSWSFSEILVHELEAARYGSLGRSLMNILPGMTAHAACTVLDALLCGALVEAIGNLELRLSRRLKRRTARKHLKIATTILMEVLCGAISVILLPLEYYAETQRLGLAPTSPLLPSWRVFLPTHPSSLHGVIWRSTTASSWLGMLSSPALLLVLQKTLTRYQGEESPLASQFTTFEFPAINTPVSLVRKPEIRKDPFGTLLYYGYLVRARALKWFGWNLTKVPEGPRRLLSETNNQVRAAMLAGNRVEQTASTNGGNEPHDMYRATSLSQQPAKYLGERIDVCITDVLMLPFQSMLLRAVARSYLNSPLPKTSFALMALHACYTPFSSGPLGRLSSTGFSISTWRHIGSYLSKFGLSLALYYSTEASIFYALYKLHRWQGLRNFGWGSAG